MNCLSKSRGTKNLISRIISILRRFGLSSKKFNRLLNRYCAVTRELGCVPTFPITAVTLKRHPELVRELCRQGVEFAVHGYIHIDYGVLSEEEQAEHYRKAIKTFNSCQVPFTGFRAPLMHINSKTSGVLRDLGFPYDSSRGVCWDVINRNEFTEGLWRERDKVLALYECRHYRECSVLPRTINGFVEIPVSTPDDEIMVDRLGVTSESKIGEIWQMVLQKSYQGGELFTLQLHPERITYCEKALVALLDKARQAKPKVWVATLREIAAWWLEKDNFAFEVKLQDDGRYRVTAACSDRATVLLRNCQASVPADEWFDGYKIVTARDFILDSPMRPVIGVSPDSSPAAVSFLKSEGYIVEKSDRHDDYAVYLDNLSRFREADEKPLSLRIEQANAPLLRFWRWPDQARSALSVTGDIDSITLVDFVLRVFENWPYKGRRNPEHVIKSVSFSQAKIHEYAD
jgi:peptidoglycan/xylan/chitin deacetylase (PgdA/CDA1 family)